MSGTHAKPNVLNFMYVRIVRTGKLISGLLPSFRKLVRGASVRIKQHSINHDDFKTDHGAIFHPLTHTYKYVFREH